MAESLQDSHRLAKFMPFALLAYLLLGDSGDYTFTAVNGEVTECSRSVDYLALGLAGVGVIAVLFLLRIAARPRSAAEERGVLGNRIGAAAIALITALLLLKGMSAEGASDLTTCAGEA